MGKKQGRKEANEKRGKNYQKESKNEKRVI